MKETIEKLLRRPWVAHMLAANERFGKRLGPQFAGAVTYFSVLSMVPVLMFAVSALGLTFTVLRPDLLPEVQNLLQEQLGDTGVTEDLNKFIAGVFRSWPSITIFALLAAAYSGSNWVKNLKHAVRAMWKDKFSDAAQTGNFFVEIAKNLFIFFGLLLSLTVAVAVTAAGQAFPKEIVGWLGLGGVPGITLLLRVAGIAVSLVASWLLVAFLFLVLPGERVRLPTWLRATFTGAVLVTLLQQGAGLLVSVLSSNKSAGVFGPIIILMIVFNLLATIILMLAAWVGTADSWEGDQVRRDAEKAVGGGQADETGIDDEDVADGDIEPSAVTLATRERAIRWAASRDADSLRSANFDPSTITVPDPSATVSEEVAAKGVRVGMGVGYGVGAATGIGIGALVAAVVGRFTRR